jgi:hypothetical protein
MAIEVIKIHLRIIGVSSKIKGPYKEEPFF